MMWLDWVLIILLVSNICSGFAGGFIYKVGTTIGGLIGLVVAGRTYNFFHGGFWAQVLSFMLIFGVIANVVGLFFKVLNRVFNLVAIIPGMKLINRIGGGALGLIEGAFFSGLILLFVQQLALPAWAGAGIDHSWVAKELMELGRSLLPLLPEQLRNFRGKADAA